MSSTWSEAVNGWNDYLGSVIDTLTAIYRSSSDLPDRKALHHISLIHSLSLPNLSSVGCGLADKRTLKKGTSEVQRLPYFYLEQ